MHLNLQDNSVSPGPGATLRRFVEKPQRAQRCELCSLELLTEHEHLVEPGSRTLLCACESCAVLFGYHTDQKYRRVPRRIEVLENLTLSDAIWNSFDIPIRLAFFLHDSATDRVVAMYPSPGGPLESTLRFDTWNELEQANPVLSDLEPDVEALLVNRLEKPHRYYRVPLDRCYALVGLIRAYWSGFSGGAEVWKQVEQYFATLDRKAVVRDCAENKVS